MFEALGKKKACQVSREHVSLSYAFQIGMPRFLFISGFPQISKWYLTAVFLAGILRELNPLKKEEVM